MDYTVHGILQARILKWVAVPFSRGSSQPRDRTEASHIAGRFFYQLSHQRSPTWLFYFCATHNAIHEPEIQLEVSLLKNNNSGPTPEFLN